MISASPTASAPSLRRLTFDAYRRAEAMGLVERALPTQEFDFTSVQKILRGVCDAGIARSPMLDLDSADTEGPDSNNVAELMQMVIAALEASPTPHFEWRSVSRVFDAECLAALLGISVSSLRRYQVGMRITPDDVAARLHFLALVISDLAGACNENGVRHWFHRQLALRGDKGPGVLLSGVWNPEDEGPQRVRALARALVARATT
jgi:hypothetical protein